MKVNYHSFIATALLFTVMPLEALEWQCEAKESFENKPRTEIEVKLSFSSNSAQLKTNKYQFKLTPLTITNTTIDYSEPSSSDLINERIESARIFRFNRKSGSFYYLDHRDKELLIVGTCTN